MARNNTVALCSLAVFSFLAVSILPGCRPSDESQPPATEAGSELVSLEDSVEISSVEIDDVPQTGEITLNPATGGMLTIRGQVDSSVDRTTGGLAVVIQVVATDSAVIIAGTSTRLTVQSGRFELHGSLSPFNPRYSNQPCELIVRDVFRRVWLRRPVKVISGS